MEEKTVLCKVSTVTSEGRCPNDKVLTPGSWQGTAQSVDLTVTGLTVGAGGPPLEGVACRATKSRTKVGARARAESGLFQGGKSDLLMHVTQIYFKQPCHVLTSDPNVHRHCSFEAKYKAITGHLTHRGARPGNGLLKDMPLYLVVHCGPHNRNRLLHCTYALEQPPTLEGGNHPAVNSSSALSAPPTLNTSANTRCGINPRYSVIYQLQGTPAKFWVGYVMVPAARLGRRCNQAAGVMR